MPYRPVWGGSLPVPHVRILVAYNGVFASSVRASCVTLSSRSGPAPRYIHGGLGLHCVRERVCLPPASATLYMSSPGPTSDRAPPLAEIKSCSPGPRRRPTHPLPRSPSLCQGMAPSSSCPAARCAGGGPLTELAGSRLPLAGREVGRPGFDVRGLSVGPASSAGLPPLCLIAEGDPLRSTTLN
jgi:hypothetical protein